MIIAQVCLRLAQIKGHSKMCNFTVLGGGPGGSVSVTTICLTQCNTSPSHRVNQVVDCSLLNVDPLLFNGCAKLLDIGRNWNTLSCTPIQSMSAEYAGHARTGMFSASRNCVQILATWSRPLSCCNMRGWSWMNGTTMVLRISSRYLCAFKMPSIKCICVCCQYHTPAHTITPPPPWATRSTTLTSVNRSPTRCHTRCLPSALYSENQDSSVKRTPLQSPRRHRM